MFMGCGCISNVLQFDNFGIFICFFCDVIIGDFVIQYVIRSNVVYYFIFCCLVVKSDNWDVCLVSYFYSIIYCVGVGWVNQQNFCVVNG